MAKRWQQADISYLQRYGKTKPVDELARRFNTDAKTVRAKLAELAPARNPTAKPAPRAASRPAPRSAAKPAAKTAPKAAPKTAPKAAPRAGAKVAPQAAAKPARKAAPKPASKPAPKAAPAKAKAPSQPIPKPSSRTAVKPQPTPKPAPRAATPKAAATRAAAAKTAATPPSKPPAPRPPAAQAHAPKSPDTAPAAKPAATPPRPPAPKPPPKPAGPDPGLAAFTDGLKAMNKQDWGRAAKLLEQAAADDDSPEIAARARQYLAAARQRLESEASHQDHEDAYLQAVFEKNRGNLAAALEICRRGGREKKDERFAYLAASIHALEGRSEEAAQALGQAVELNPKNRIHAFHDADFAELRKDRDFRELFDFP